MKELALALVPILAALLMGFLVRGSERTAPTTEDGALVLRYPGAVRGALLVLAILLALLAAAGFVIAFFEDMPVPAMCIVLGVAGFFALFAPYLWLERDVIVLVDGGGVRKRDWRRRYRSLAWDQLSALSYSPANHRWRLAGRGGEVLRVSSMLLGAREFPDRVRHNVTGQRWRRWSREIERYQAARKQLTGTGGDSGRRASSLGP